VNNFYDPFKLILERAWKDNLTKLRPDQIIHFADSAEQAVKWVEDVTSEPSPVRDKNSEKQVLRLSSVMGTPEVGQHTEEDDNSDANYNFDDWDSLLDPYQLKQAIGRDEGLEAGRKAGHDQGFGLGQTTALNYGVPLGFIQGVVAAIQHQGSPISSQAVKTLHSLSQALLDFPRTTALFPQLTTKVDPNNTSNDMVTDDTERPRDEKDSPNVRQAWQRIQTRFRLLMVQLGRPDISLESILRDSNAPNPSLTSEW
jgi:hypothetical protein